MVFQPHRFSRIKAYWKSFIDTIKEVDQVVLLPTYSAGEKNNSFDSQFLFSKLKNKNKIYCRSINCTINELKQLNYDNTVLLLQGAGDIKNILDTLKNNDSK